MFSEGPKHQQRWVQNRSRILNTLSKKSPHFIHDWLNIGASGQYAALRYLNVDDLVHDFVTFTPQMVQEMRASEPSPD